MSKSAAITPPAMAAGQAGSRQTGEASNAHCNTFAEVIPGGEAYDNPDLRMLGRRTMSSTAKSRRTLSTRHLAADEGRQPPNDFRGSGIAWTIISPALCTVVGLIITFFFTGNFLFALAASTILRAVGLCAAMVPALFSKNGFRLERRRTFTVLCFLSLVAVLVAWALWHKGIPRWPQVLITISDVFLSVAGAQLAISSAHELALVHLDGMVMDGRLADLEARRNYLSRERFGSHV